MRQMILTAVSFCIVSLGPASADLHRGDSTSRATATAAEATAVARGIAFLQDDAAKWRAERKCSNCHHGVMTVWALSEAKRQRFAVDELFLADTVKWTKERLEGIDKPRDPRPGWNMVSTPALYLSIMAQLQPEQDILSPEEQRQIVNHVGTHLEEDGSVLTPATMTPPMAQNGPPPVFESREEMTLFAVLAMQPGIPHTSKSDSALEEAYHRANGYLSSVTPGEDTQSMALRLLVAKSERRPKKIIRAGIDALLKRQNADGGWGQIRELPSDAYATGQTLYILSLAGVDRRKPEIQRAISFLVANQRPDGSWPMKSRAHPGAKPMTNPLPIGHFGSSWAVLGLVRSVDNRE